MSKSFLTYQNGVLGFNAMSLNEEPQSASKSFKSLNLEALNFKSLAFKSLAFKSLAFKPLDVFIKNYQGPQFIYNLDLISDRLMAMKQALPKVRLFYAMKANPFEEILKLFLQHQIGVDVVSLGEIKRAQSIGFTLQQMVYSGVGKTKSELEYAIQNEIYQINIESLPELQRIIEIAQQLKKKARVAFRINPDMSIDTHPYIATGLRDNKFGIDMQYIDDLFRMCENNLNSITPLGISLHLGSQMMDFSSLGESIKKLTPLFKKFNTHFSEFKAFDIGGGLGIFYEQQSPMKELELLSDYSQTVFDALGDLQKAIPGFEIQSEPGRWLVAHSGVLLTQIQYIKQTPYKEFVIVDSGMNHLLRPSLYQAHHEILPLKESAERTTKPYDVVGPICESSDFFAKNRTLKEVFQDEFLVIADCGAYGASMSSDYNLQNRAYEFGI